MLGDEVDELSVVHTPVFTVEYRNHAVVDTPLGVTELFSVADVAVSNVCALVVTVGAPCVLNVNTAPNALPSLFSVIAQ
jgi:hypothetical protein